VQNLKQPLLKNQQLDIYDENWKFNRRAGPHLSIRKLVYSGVGADVFLTQRFSKVDRKQLGISSSPERLISAIYNDIKFVYLYLLHTLYIPPM
jgi:hypothetical protein